MFQKLTLVIVAFVALGTCGCSFVHNRVATVKKPCQNHTFQPVVDGAILTGILVGAGIGWKEFDEHGLEVKSWDALERVAVLATVIAFVEAALIVGFTSSMVVGIKRSTGCRGEPPDQHRPPDTPAHPSPVHVHAGPGGSADSAILSYR